MSRPRRSLQVLECRNDARLLAVALAHLRQALDGSGPGVLPVPADDPVLRDRIVAAMRPAEPIDPDIAVVIATSGSTGEPKGVELSAAALTASAYATLDRLSGPGQWLLALPVTHIAGMQVLVRSLVAGTEPVVLGTPGGFTAEAFVAASGRLCGTRRYTALVPTQLVRLLDAGGAAAAALSSYDAVLLGGAATPAPLLDRACAAGVRVLTTYGMSETAGGCVYDGRPLPGASVEVEADGRITLGGPTLAGGYRLRPDLTATAFAGGRFRTGDLGRFDDDGRLVVLGRADDVIVTGGEKVAPGPVEAALAEHPLVREVAVVGVADAQWGQRVVAVVVPGVGVPTLEALRAHVTARLGRAAAPRALRLAETLPLLPSGKIDRAALAASPPDTEEEEEW